MLSSDGGAAYSIGAKVISSSAKKQMLPFCTHQRESIELQVAAQAQQLKAVLHKIDVIAVKNDAVH